MTNLKSSQPILSSYFSPQAKTPLKKRKTSPIDLTLDSDDDSAPPPPKRSKLLEATPARPTYESSSTLELHTPRRNIGDISISQSPLAKFRYQPSPQGGAPGGQVGITEELLSAEEIQAKKIRREAFQRKLGDPFVRQSSLQIEESGPDYSRELANEALDADLLEQNTRQSSGEPELSEKLEALKKNHAAPKRPGKIRSTKESASSAPAKKRAKKQEEVGPSGQTYTPLEKQVLEMKSMYPDCLLLFEVGYKYRFFGDDAKIAAKELGIVCFPDRNFLTASIPVHRRSVHVKKLISQGHKVGIIGQTETAALKKAGDNRNAPFERKLTNLYTAATYIDELSSPDDAENITRAPALPLLCLVESLAGGMGADQNVVLGMVSVIPSTGEVTYDEWEDSHMRTELETRITHLRPTEIILPQKKLSKSTEKMIEHYAGNKRFNVGTNIRVDRFEDEMDYTASFSFISKFFDRSTPSSSQSANFRRGNVLALIVDFPKKVVVALAHTIQHLTLFGVADSLLEATFFSAFTHRSHMLLAGSTLTNLEIYRNNTDFREMGSLLWILDHTKTKFGSRLLKSWVGRPLVYKSILQERIDAIQEILENPPPAFDVLRTLFKDLPDLVKGLARIIYGKATPKEAASLITAYQRIGNAFDPIDDPKSAGFISPLWNDIVASLPRIRGPISTLISCLNVSKARFDSDKADLWADEEKFPDLDGCKWSILAVQSELAEQLKLIRKQIKRPSINFTSVAGEEYLIEIRKTDTKIVPANWMRVSGTKSVTRYHTPEVKKKLEELAQHKEQLVIEADKAWTSFLKEWAEYYGLFRDVTSKLAVADCLISLSAVSAQPGYTKPSFVDEDKLEFVDARHPMVEAIRSDPYVPNTISMGGSDTRTKIITGPNMGGKSTCCRAVALITVMAQIGCYVPASKATLSLHDAILTRMGAADELARGRSTFMVEMQETSDILAAATSKSLLILDELGRGTSTHDGQAIASAVLQHLVEKVKPKTLFITHYPLIAAEFEKKYDDVANMHAGFTEHQLSNGSRTLSFLYRFSHGIAQSYGIECARLAGLPESILSNANIQSERMRCRIEHQVASNRFRKSLHVAMDTTQSLDARTKSLEELKTMSQS